MKYRVLFLFSLLFSINLVAQQGTLSGVVFEKETGQPLIGATVIIEGTAKGASTDFDGTFTLNNISLGEVVKISYLGFITQTQKLTSLNSLNIYLESDAEALEQVVVIGYGSQKIREVTGSVAVVDSKTIEDLKPQRIEQAIQGQVAGVQITAGSGSPGSNLNINIRGISTNGDNRPLILLDGSVIEDLSVVNPSDIESINVLKDATAGIYGVRAANGVIIITSKGGRKESPPKFTVNTYAGIQETTRKLPVLNATEYALLVNEARTNGGQAPLFSDVSSLGEGTDWQDEIFETAPIYSFDIGVSGGGKKSKYSVGASYLSQDGIIASDKSNFERATARVKYNVNLTDNFRIDVSGIHSYISRGGIAEGGLGSVLFNAVNNAPTLPVRDENGEFSLSEGLGAEVVNPLAQISNTFNNTQINRTTATLGLNYKFLNYFEAESRIQANYSDVKNFVFVPLQFYGEGKVFNVVSAIDEDTGELVDQNNVTESSSVFRDYTFDAFLKYNRSFNDSHNVSALLGTSIFQTVGRFWSTTAFGIIDNDISNASVAQATGRVDVGFRNGGDRFDSRLLSYFTRVQYDYKGKYLFSGLLRRDGSTAFGPENKFGYFPSASLGWVASDESFLESSNTFDFLKLRASYGIIGNDRIGNFLFTSQLNGEAAYIIDEELIEGAAVGVISNPEIRWEEQKTFDIGLDARFFNNKLNVTADYFNKRTDDLLIFLDVSGILGAAAPGSGAPAVNAGSVENKGFELSLGYQDSIGDDFSFNTSINVTTINNEVLEVNNETGFSSGGSFGIGQADPSRFEEGFPIGYFRGLETDGLFQSQAEIAASSQPDAVPGDIRFVDQDGDGVIDVDADGVELGDPIPDVTLGYNLSMEYKNFDFSLYAFASIGNDIVRNFERFEPLTNRTTSFLDRYTGPGTSNSVPLVSTASSQNILFSDFFVEDGSFLRLQTIQLGYTFKEVFNQALNVDSLRIYGSVSNAFTLTNYSGFDPTISSGSAVGAGIDSGNYPTPRSFLLGINLNF